MSICYIIGAGECGKIDFLKNEDDFVICADGGLEYAERFGIVPDLIVGDFDSYKKTPASDSVIILPTEKDETDTHYAVKKGFEKGFTDFRLYGMLGGRIDHSLANIQLLMYIINCGGTAILCGDDFDVTVIKNSSITLDGEKGKYVSVFSYSPESHGVNIIGLKYELSDYTLKYDNPLGVSNEFIGKKAVVEVREGELLLTIQK